MQFFLTVLLILLLPSSILAEDKIQIAVVVPLSGGLAEYGTALKNGFELARKEKKEFSEKIELRYEDSRYENSNTVSIINKLSSDNVTDLVYLWGYGPCQAAAPVAQSRRMPVIAVTGEQGVNVGREYITRFCYRIEQLSLAILKHMRAKKWRSIGFIKAEIAYMNGIIDGLRTNLKDDESVEVVDSFNPSDMDFRASIGKMKSRKFDAIGVFLLTGQVSQFYKQAHALQFHTNTFGASPFENLSEIKSAEGLMDGAVFPGVDVDDDFRRRYMQEFGNDVQIGWAANSYDFALVTLKMHSQLQGTVPAGSQLLTQFEKAVPFDGVEGKIVFRPDALHGGGYEFPVVMKRVVGESIAAIPESRISAIETTESK